MPRKWLEDYHYSPKVRSFKILQNPPIRNGLNTFRNHPLAHSLRFLPPSTRETTRDPCPISDLSCEECPSRQAQRGLLISFWKKNTGNGEIPSGKLTSYGTSPSLISKSTINGPFSIAMLNYQRVPSGKKYDKPWDGGYPWRGLDPRCSKRCPSNVGKDVFYWDQSLRSYWWSNIYKYNEVSAVNQRLSFLITSYYIYKLVGQVILIKPKLSVWLLKKNLDGK